MLQYLADDSENSGREPEKRYHELVRKWLDGAQEQKPIRIETGPELRQFFPGGPSGDPRLIDIVALGRLGKLCNC